ncbi:MAG: endonuclease Q family protein [Candidatus Diapherotrites archaeon]|nr:endonuclease Q family protein [Candidatus Diapherotrites archaeon]
MKEYNADLHLHGKYSGGVSKNMELGLMAEQAKLKGLHILATGDVLHKEWLRHIKANLIEETNGLFKHKKFDCYFIIQTEVECKDRVHHIIFFPSIESAEEMREKLGKFGDLDLEGFGRPKLKCSAETIVEKAEEVGAIVGPAHAFTPYFSVYAHFDSLKQLYKEMYEKIYYIELGLSADSYLADLITENHNYSFITASDAHSPWPFRLGREFTRFRIREPSFKEIKRALIEKEEKKITLNVGLDPREGKYHRTACNKCYTKYNLEQAQRNKWRCVKCNGTIKKGVKERILELAKIEESEISKYEANQINPEFRPPYIHIIPLAEIIQITLKEREPNSEKVQKIWKNFVEVFENEIFVLIDAKIEELSELNKEVAENINCFRKGLVVYEEGGGGNYGKPIICKDNLEIEKLKEEIKKSKKDFSKQRTLNDF